MSIKEFFYLQKSDRKAILLVLLVAVVSLALVFVVGGKQTETELTADDSLAMETRRDTFYHYSRAHAREYYYKVENRRAELFPFDPNTADSTQLLRLGLRPWQVRNIYKYRAAGGFYRRPSDFARLYGLSPQQYERLRPYIQINDYYHRESHIEYDSPHEDFHRDTILYPVKLIPGETVSLNTADTTQLKHVPSIGSGYARRIVRYRQMLGGFCQVEQLREIDGFPESALPYFVLGETHLRKLSVNRLTLTQLKAHPYINFYQAKAITDYRRLYGNLESIRQLRLLKEFTEADLKRLEPYLDYE